MVAFCGIGIWIILNTHFLTKIFHSSMLISLDEDSDTKEIAVKGKSERTPPHLSKKRVLI